MDITKLIINLEVYRDNAIARGDFPVASGELADAVRKLTGQNPIHDRAIDARMADDLRKLAHFTASFRKACVEFSINRYRAYDPNDPDRFRRLYMQGRETGLDIMQTIRHMGFDR
jgi:hypothetical protein